MRRKGKGKEDKWSTLVSPSPHTFSQHLCRMRLSGGDICLHPDDVGSVRHTLLGLEMYHQKKDLAMSHYLLLMWWRFKQTCCLTSGSLQMPSCRRTLDFSSQMVPSQDTCRLVRQKGSKGHQLSLINQYINSVNPNQSYMGHVSRLYIIWLHLILC